MDIRGAIFDMDGTLLDSMWLWNSMGSEFLLRRGIEPEPDIDKKFKAMSIVESAAYYKEHYGIDDSPDEIRAQINSYVEEGYGTRVTPKKGVVRFLEQLRDRGVKMAVATSTDRYLVDIALDHCGLKDFFQFILTCTEVGCDKNVPDIYIKAQELMDVRRDQTVVFEDAPHAIKSAKSGGFAVAGIADDSYVQERPALIEMCDAFIYSYEDLLSKPFDIPVK